MFAVSQSSVEADERARRIAEVQNQVELLSDAAWFAKEIAAVLVTVSHLFKSVNTSDVTEAIEFVVTCHEFQVSFFSSPPTRSLWPEG